MENRNHQSSPPVFHADQPVTDPSHDAYNRRPFAEGLARAVQQLPKHECFVIGLHGPWGDGKTSALRFVEASLKTDPSTILCWFNPWRFLHEEEMLKEFFSILTASVHAQLSTRIERMTARASQRLKLVGLFDDRAAKAGEAAAEKAEAKIETSRQRLKAALRSAGKRLVVFIDDIDRLDAPEVAALFRLIKACADLPGVVYILAFDREMVARTLGTRLADGDAEAGRRYLEKIIQIPVPLPPASRRDLNRACMQALGRV